MSVEERIEFKNVGSPWKVVDSTTTRWGKAEREMRSARDGDEEKD